MFRTNALVLAGKALLRVCLALSFASYLNASWTPAAFTDIGKYVVQAGETPLATTCRLALEDNC
jgi:hypothetical protein